MARNRERAGRPAVRDSSSLTTRLTYGSPSSFCCGHRATVEMAGSPLEVLRIVAERAFDLLLIDLNYARDTTSGQEGLDLLAQLRARHPDLPIVVMTAWGSIQLAVEALRRGARDFI